MFSAPRHADADGEGEHIATAVVGTRGGVGASTIATSLAWLFSTEHRRSTALLDLDVHFGTGALSLDLEPGRGLTDAIENPSRIDGLFIERAMIRANDNLAIMSAEAPINSPLMTDGTAFRAAGGGIPSGLRHDGDRSAAQHADQLPASVDRCERGDAGDRTDAGIGARYHPHPFVA